MNRFVEQDVNEFARTFALADQLQGATVLITGATGLIGSTLVRCLAALNRNVRIVAPVRDAAKADKMLCDIRPQVEIVECDLCNADYEGLGTTDYIIHCAAPTASAFFVTHPVETFDTITLATAKLLQYARNAHVKSFVYLSSLEVYGSLHDDSQPVTEDVQGYIDPLSVRSSYPMAKRAAENLCCLYASEYGVPAKIARLTQTTGAGAAADDNRVIVQFVRRAVEGQDIVLHTTGESARPYCYTTDAIEGILYILLRGKDGQAYNVANPSTYISARQLAEFAREHINPSINVRVEQREGMGYAPPTRQRLCTARLEALGWQPRHDLRAIVERLGTSEAAHLN